MGRLINGKWVVEEVNPKTKDGEFHRQQQKFRDWISDSSQFKPEPNRYHLYISHACPWAHRTLIMRSLKQLEPLISVSVVHPDMLSDGWSFEPGFAGATQDHIFNKKFLRDIYTEVDPEFTGRVTVPILLDKKNKKIVNNESADIVRIFNESFNKLTGNKEDYYPWSLRDQIDQINEDVYENINNGVYKCGFARTQAAYDHNFDNLAAAMERVEKALENKNYLVGNRLTEADIRLYTTLIRFDVVYYCHFKCNYKLVREFKNLRRYLTALYDLPGFGDTTEFRHIKRHYYYSHETINPFRIVPKGPALVMS